LGFPTGQTSTHHQAIFRALLPGIEEEETPTSTTYHQRIFSGTVAEEKEDFCKGSLSLLIFYFVIVLLYFIFVCIFFLKIQKN
jgi:hypothetical protein